MKRLSLVFVLLLAAFTSPLAAHENVGDLTGFVAADLAGARAPLGGVMVTATARVGNVERSTLSVGNGAYAIPALPAGLYDVSFAKGGMQTLMLRVSIQLARTSRLDARLQVSTEGETVTRTQTVDTVLGDGVVATTIDAAMIDALPLTRSVGARLALLPGLATVPFGDVLHGSGEVERTVGAAPSDPSVVNEIAEGLDETTALTAALPVEYGRGRAGIAITSIKRGSDDWEGTLRVDLSSPRWTAGDDGANRSGLAQLFELAGGGPVVTDRLSIFSALAYSNENTRYSSFDVNGTEQRVARGALFRLDGALTPSQALIANAAWGRERVAGSIDDPFPYAYGDVASDRSLSANYIGQWGSRWTSDLVAGETRSACGSDCPYVRSDRSVRAQFWRSFEGPLGRLHTLTAGFDGNELAVHGSPPHDDALFIEDRWDVSARLSIRGGARIQTRLAGTSDGRVLPRLAAVYDLRGDGRERVSASFSRYAVTVPKAAGSNEVRPYTSRTISEATLAFGSRIARGGSATVTYVHRWRGESESGDAARLPRRYDGVELAAEYRFLTFLRIGGNYTYASLDLPLATQPLAFADEPFSRNRANVWGIVAIPLPFGSIGVSLLERYRSNVLTSYGESEGGALHVATGTIAQTDLSTTYTFPVKRTELFVRGDLLNAFDSEISAAPHEELPRRTYRFAVGARF